MPVLATRKRVVDTYVAKELATPSKVMICDAAEYRAFKGELMEGECKIPGYEGASWLHKDVEW